MFRKLLYFFLFVFLVSAIGAGIFIATLPDVAILKKTNPTRTSLMELREKQAKAKGKKLKTVVHWRPLNQMSLYLVHAVLAAEDDQFYRHKGFDYEQIKIAIKRNWEKKRYVYGGSTISQQCARSLYLSPRKNLFRKLREAAITFQMERHLPKSRILEIYLNVIEWGNGIYGAEAAAQHYFKVSAADLNPTQAAALASILPSPRRWDPFSEKGVVARRRASIVRWLQRDGYVEVEESTETVTMETPAIESPEFLEEITPFTEPVVVSSDGFHSLPPDEIPLPKEHTEANEIQIQSSEPATPEEIPVPEN